MQTARHLLHTLPSLPLWTFVQGEESVPVRKFLVMAWLTLLPTVAFAQDRIRMEETQRSEVTIVYIGIPQTNEDFMAISM